jgi:hypothetical protein
MLVSISCCVAILHSKNTYIIEIILLFDYKYMSILRVAAVCFSAFISFIFFSDYWHRLPLYIDIAISALLLYNDLKLYRFAYQQRMLLIMRKFNSEDRFSIFIWRIKHKSFLFY